MSMMQQGNRQVVEERNGRKVQYEYDDLYRLKKEVITDADASNRTIEFEYDAVGNRLKQKDSVAGETSYFYDDNDRLLREELRQNGTLQRTIYYEYDDNGNTTKKRVVSVGGVLQETVYSWDGDNRLVGVQKPNGDVIEYAYDTDGIRVSSTVNGVTTQYLVDKNRDYAQVLAEYQNNNLQVEYVYGLDLISQEQGADKSFYLVDGLGSTRGLTDEGSSQIAAYNYDAFGNLLNAAGGVENNYLFAGEQFDNNLGDYYLRARYYNTRTGGFISRDSFNGDIYDPLSQHKYQYAHRNPISNTDPSGLMSLLDINISNKLLAKIIGLTILKTLSIAYVPGIMVDPFSRERDSEDDVIVYVVSDTLKSLPFGHAAIEVDGIAYHLSIPGYRKEEVNSYIISEQQEYKYGYYRYAINYSNKQKQKLKISLDRAIKLEKPYTLIGGLNHPEGYFYMNQCTTFVSQSLPSVNFLFDSLVKSQSAPAGLGWGLDMMDILSRGSLVKRLKNIAKPQKK
jgi:RHS repeat-associated protein